MKLYLLSMILSDDLPHSCPPWAIKQLPYLADLHLIQNIKKHLGRFCAYHVTKAGQNLLVFFVELQQFPVL